MSLSSCQHFIRDRKYPFQRRTYPLRVTLTNGHTCVEYAEIGLLIACDVPTIFDPLEVKHCRNSGPYVSPTSMGRVVKSPLGRHHKGPLATSFFIKAEPEFHQMVKDFYDSGFSESSADDKPEMSQEELRFLRELECTVVLRDDHYEMALPLKDRKAPVPNNKLTG